MSKKVFKSLDFSDDPFSRELARFFSLAEEKSWQALGAALGITRVAAYSAARREKIPDTWYRRAMKRHGVLEDWLRTGDGPRTMDEAAGIPSSVDPAPTSTNAPVPPTGTGELARCSMHDLSELFTAALTKHLGKDTIVEISSLSRSALQWVFQGAITETATVEQTGYAALVRDPGPGGMPLRKLRVTPVQESPRDYTEDT